MGAAAGALGLERYSAFISYSHADRGVARWLHGALETYRLPKALVGGPSPFGAAPRRLAPVFRDRDELPASSDLGEALQAALAQSRFQIVLCTPRAARSRWVNEEILIFKRFHGETRTLAVIVAGHPHAGDETECLPQALRFKLGPDGAVSDVRAHPIAADIRPGKDGRRLALLKLIAGLTGLPLDSLVRRDAARRQQQMAFITGGAIAVSVAMAGLAVYANVQRVAAERQRQLADRSLDFLIGTFAIANPATENPRTLTVLSVLDRVSKRAGTELGSEPAMSARLLETTGEIYRNLGLPKDSERDLRAALAQQAQPGEGRAKTLIDLAWVAYERGDAKAAQGFVDAASRAYDPHAAYAPALGAQIAELGGKLEFLRGRYAKAAETLRRAAARYQGLPGDHRFELGRAWIGEGLALVRVKDYAGADAAFAGAERIYMTEYGPNHVRTGNAIQDRALAAFEAGRLPEAEQRMTRAIAVYDRVLDPDHPTIAASLLLLGRIRTARGDAAGAVTALSRARGIYERLYGPRNPAVGDADFYLAEAETARGDTDAALRRLAETKTIYDASYGPDDPDQVELLMARMKVYRAAGRTGEARADCAAAVSLQVRIDPRDPGLAALRVTCAALTPGSASAKLP
jgi:tetratricopeptide (TPR) repeat protein